MSDGKAFTNATDSTSEPQVERFCIQCGYNLRALTSRNCPECGYEILPEAVSSIPWEHRQQLGRLRAFWRTLRLASLWPVRLARATGTELDEASAILFTRIVAVASAVPVILVFLLITWGNDFIDDWGLRFYQPEPGHIWQQWFWELAILWGNGARLLPVIPLGIAAMFWLMCHSHWPLLIGSSLPDSLHKRAKVAARYACASLAWILPAILPVLAFYSNGILRIGLADVGGLLLLDLGWLIPIWYLWNGARFSATVTGGGFARGVVAIMLLLTGGALAAFLGIFLLPTLIGFLRIVIQSLM